MDAVSQIPGQEQLITSGNGCGGKSFPEIFLHDENRGAGVRFIRRVARMNADEEIRLIIIRNRGSGFVIERNVGIPRQQNRRSEAGLKRRSQFSSERQREILLCDCRALCSGVHAAMAGVDNHDPNFPLCGNHVGPGRWSGW